MTTLIGLTPHEENLCQLLEPTVTDCGLEVVRIKLVQRGRQILEVMVDGQKGERVNLDQCAEASRRMSRVLDVEDPIDGNYALEVSSPGVERPLVTVQALKEQIGNTVKANLNRPVEGQRKWIGTLKDVKEFNITLTTKEGDVELNYADVRELQRQLSQEETAQLLKGLK